MDFGFTRGAGAAARRGAQVPRRALPDRGSAQASPRRPRASRASCGSASAELGWVGLTMPEAYGGVGLGCVDWSCCSKRPGRALFPSPLVSSRARRPRSLRGGSAAQRARWLPRLADGSAIGTVARCSRRATHRRRGRSRCAAARTGDGFVLAGEKLFVRDAAAADLFVVAFRSGDAPEALSPRPRRARRVRRRGGGPARHRPHQAQRPAAPRRRARAARRRCSARRARAWPALARLLDLGAFAVARRGGRRGRGRAPA